MNLFIHTIVINLKLFLFINIHIALFNFIHLKSVNTKVFDKSNKPTFILYYYAFRRFQICQKLCSFLQFFIYFIYRFVITREIEEKHLLSFLILYEIRKYKILHFGKKFRKNVTNTTWFYSMKITVYLSFFSRKLFKIINNLTPSLFFV